MEASASTELLKDGDTIDLGGGGDTIMAGPIYTHLPTGDHADLARSARRLTSELRGQVRTVYCQHILRYCTDPAFLAEVADGAEKVVEGAVKPVRGGDILGGDVAEYWFDRFSITTPWDPSLAQ